jgi:hypothetical protein
MWVIEQRKLCEVKLAWLVKRSVTGVREKVTFIGSVLEEADSPLARIEERYHSLRGFVFQRQIEEAIDDDVGVRFKILIRF